MMPEQNGANWLNNILYIVDENTVINVETQRQVPYDGVVPLEELLGGLVSPDGTEMSLNDRIVNLETGETVRETSEKARWLVDGSGYFMQVHQPDDLTSIYNRDGTLRFSYPVFYATVSQTGRWIAWNETSQESADGASHSYLLNTEDGQKVDLCGGGDFLFSPDDTLMVFFTVGENRAHILGIVDLTTWKTTLIDYSFMNHELLLGWSYFDNE